MTPHRTALGSSRWELWRDAALVSSGFPASRITAICDDGVAGAADQLAAGASGAPERFAAAYAAARRRLAAAIKEIAAEPRFREAVAWQQPALLVECLDRAAAGKLSGQSGRTRELTIARLLQRYCLSNQTLGFSGPVGWASIDADARCLEVTPGPAQLSRRTTYFDSWAIESLAGAIAARPEVLPWLVPRIESATVVDGRTLQLPFRELVELSETEVRVLALCDGDRTVRAVTGDPADPGLLAALMRLRSLGAVRIGLDVPISAWPERDLEDRVRRITDPAVRRRALEEVAELTAARDAVGAASGDADAVYRASGALAELFAQKTGIPARRHLASPAGRRLVYEDTVRDVEVRIGSRLTDALAPPLSLLLDSAAWLVNTVAVRYLALCRRIVDQARTGNGAVGVPLLSVAVNAMPELFLPTSGAEPATVAEVVAEFQERWRRVLAIPPGLRRYRVSAAAIAERAAREFATGPAVWSSARTHTVDLLVSAAVTQGDCQFVLGGLHLATNSLENRVFVAQHPDADRLLAGAEADHLGRRVYAIPKRNSPFVTSRLNPPTALLSSSYTYVCLGAESVLPPDGARTLPVGKLLVAPSGAGLVVRCGRDGPEYAFAEVIGEMLTALVAPAFRLLDTSGYHPRVSIDGMVLARESWVFSATTAAWAFIKDERRRYAAARQWRAGHGLPERVLGTSPPDGEVIVVDFRSLPLVGLLAHLVLRASRRGSGVFRLTEMLPDTDQLWLHDAAGRRYTAELKLVSVNSRIS